jgi:hypothetical protein
MQYLITWYITPSKRKPLVKRIKSKQEWVRLCADYQIKPHVPPARYSEPLIILNFSLATVVIRRNA